MKIAIIKEGQEVSDLIVQCEQVAVITIVEGQVIDQIVVDACEQPNELLGQYLRTLGVDVIITKHIDSSLLKDLEALNLIVIDNIEGDIQTVLEDYLSGKLTSNKGSCTGCTSCSCGHK